MEEMTFTGLGTRWSVSVDADRLEDTSREAILQYVKNFEQRFSRFLETSEVNAFRNARAGTYRISPDLARLLDRASRLRELTEGRFDPAVGQLIEHAGYDADYRFAVDEGVESFCLPQWSLAGNELTLDGSTVFDLGGIGKGYCIDGVAEVLRKHGYLHYLVEGGGDMVGTTKATGEAFRVAVEWPGREGVAVGVVELHNQALAASDSFRRRWGAWHHIIDPKTKTSVQGVIGCVAVAPSAWDADCMTSGLFLSLPEQHARLAQAFQASYLVFQENETVTVSSNWKGELF
jgi:thiamine biosynthesis lipoprotein